MIPTIAKTHSSMGRSPHRTGLSLDLHLTPVLHKDYTMATHMSHSHGAGMPTQARSYYLASTEGSVHAAIFLEWAGLPSLSLNNSPTPAHT